MAGERMLRPRAAVPVSRAVRWTRRLALIAVGLGLVLMHHVVGAHQHTPTEPVPGWLAGVEATATAGHGSDPAPGSPHSPAAALHVHHEDGGHDMAAMLLHDCLAVLGAAALVLVLWLLRGTVSLVRDVRSVVPAVRPGRSRPPAPVPVLLAQLQVLRL